jgi:hypothetical protein
MNREQIYTALFVALTDAPGFKTRSRRLKHWNDVPAQDQAAWFMSQTGEVAMTVSGMPTKWRLSVEIYIYTRLQDKQDPGPVLNPLIDGICNILNTPHPITGVQSLNLNNVAWAAVEGNIQIDEGTLDNQAVAIIPVVILAT